VDRKLIACIIIIIILAGAVLFFVLRDFGVFGRGWGRQFGGQNYPMDNNSFMATAKNSLGLPADASEGQVKEALGLPEDATFEQIREALIQQGRLGRPAQGENTGGS
jgi:hypothetical protein